MINVIIFSSRLIVVKIQFRKYQSVVADRPETGAIFTCIIIFIIIYRTLPAFKAVGSMRRRRFANQLHNRSIAFFRIDVRVSSAEIGRLEPSLPNRPQLDTTSNIYS
jgi:hypothetical protein